MHFGYNSRYDLYVSGGNLACGTKHCGYLPSQNDVLASSLLLSFDPIEELR